MSAWTPGHYQVEPLRHDARGQLAIVAADDWSSRFPIKQTLAIIPDGKDAAGNSELFALAPEMANALERVHTWLICPALDRETLQEMQTMVGKVLAKLEGDPAK